MAVDYGAGGIYFERDRSWLEGMLGHPASIV